MNPPSEEINLENKKTLISGLKSKIIIIIAVIAFLGIEIYLLAANNNLQSNPSTKILLTISPANETLQVKYTKREKIFDTVKTPIKYEFKKYVEGEEYYEYKFFKIGLINAGTYKGGELILAKVTSYGACKSLSCGKPFYLRYIKLGNVATLISKISHPIDYKNDRTSLTKANPFEKFNLTMLIDYEFTIPDLEYPNKITDNSRRILTLGEYKMEEDGEIDNNVLYSVFTDPLYGKIFTTKPEFSPEISFDIGEAGAEAGEPAYIDFTFTESCEGSNCFTTNAFLLFRPDGTFLKYVYNPDFAIEDIKWKADKTNDSDYISKTISGCTHITLDESSVVSSSSAQLEDLIIIGEVDKTKDPIYEIKDNNHKLYIEFYNSYKKYFSNSYTLPEKAKIKSYAEFISSKPILLWRDPFDRLIRFNNDQFLPPHMCEPIIYLYPEYTKKITIKLGSLINITNADPIYNGSWNVIAKPSGELLNLKNNLNYPYLFWEGWSYIFPIQRKGFVVRRSDVGTFFENTLPKLGLNGKETKDFMQTWMPKFSDSPFYLITFIDKELISAIAPIEVTPKPDTIIRILMDYKSLDREIAIDEQTFPKPPERKGFTLVEWGGIKR